MENKLSMPGQSRIFAAVMGAVVIVFAFLTVIAGLPPADKLTNFVIGLIILIAVTGGIGVLLWHFLLRPLPAGIQVVEQPLLTVRTRQIIALVLTLGTISIGIAGVWDEIWHVKYGIPFGQDFFWRPHILLYFGLSTLAVVGGWSWWTLMTKGKGTLQQRFRANPLLGLSFLGGLFTIYAVGADPIWHKFYGSDLAPWSVPHLLILIMVFMTGILAITYHKTLIRPAEWRMKVNLHWREVLMVIITAGALLDFMLILTIQWYGAATSERQMTQVMGYPIWLTAVFITFLAALFGTTALHATRQVGTATVVGVLTFVMRLLLDNVLSGVRVGTTPLWVIIPLMLSLDIIYAVSIRRTQRPPSILMTAVVMAAAFAIVSIPAISVVFPFLPLAPLNIVSMVIASFIVAGGTVWFVRYIADLNAPRDIESAPASQASVGLPRAWTNALLYVVYLAFVVLWVATATPPA
jgi:hypothetical protein